MRTVRRHLTEDSIALLRSCIGSTWKAYGSEYLDPELDVATDYVFVETTAMTLELRVAQEMLELEGEPDGYAVLTLKAGSIAPSANRNGDISAIFSGQIVRDVHLLASEVHESVNGKPTFTYEAHDGVVFELDHGWIGISKYGMWADQLVISTVSRREDLDLYDALGDWDPDLEVRYTGWSRLISIGGAAVSS